HRRAILWLSPRYDRDAAYFGGTTHASKAKRRRDDRGIAQSMIDLERECDTFCTAMIGHPPPESVRAAYVRAHEAGSIQRGLSEKPTRFDDWLVRFARGGPARTSLADSYS